MNRRKFIKSLGLAAFGMSMSGCLPGRSFGRNDPAEKQPPNVILLLTDDMGYGDIAAHGNPIIKTPNFDALHSQSARFTNFAVSPTCAPTRAALLTGKHEFLSGVTHTISPMNQLNMEANIIPQLFKKKGYKTGLFGKWHLGQEGEYGPWNRGFDETLTVPGDKQDSHFNPVLLKNQVETKFKGYRTDILFDEAMKFIEQHKEQPFFIYLPTYSPHGPLKVPEKYIDPYMPLKEREEYKGLKVPPPFFGMVANVDENLGRLMAKLEELGIDDDTILIAINDNGGTNGVDVWNAGMRGMKSTAWLGGIRAYSFWKWGDRFSVGDRPQMSGHIDVLPTLADLCGLEISDELQAQLEGDSLLPALETPDRNGTSPNTKTVVCAGNSILLRRSRAGRKASIRRSPIIAWARRALRVGLFSI
jgi:arylsulfatase A-like enzyme